jgi:hypothetical protein
MKFKSLLITLILVILFTVQSFALPPTFYINGVEKMDLRIGNSILNFSGGTQNWTLMKEFAGWHAKNNFGYYTNFSNPSPSIIFPGSASAVSYATTNIAAGTDVGLYLRADLDRWYGDPNLYSHTNFTTGTYDNNYQFFYVFDVRAYRGTGVTYTLDTDNEDFSTGGDFDYLVYVDDSGAGPDYDHNDMILGVSSIPEPGTFILMGMGLAGLQWYRRKK